MKISKYKEGLFSNDLSKFKKSIKKLKNENATYGEIKRLNNIIQEHIDNIGKEDIIENDLYRIISSKYALPYLLGLSLQSEVDFAEYRISHLKYVGCYSHFKNEGISDDKRVEGEFKTGILDSILSFLQDYHPYTKNGFENIEEIYNVIKNSNLEIALSNLDKLIEKEYKFKDKTPNLEITEENIEEILENNFKGMFQSERDYVNSSNKLSKITILHIPFFNDLFPSIFIPNINTIVVSECFFEEQKERRFLSEFGMYVQYMITKDLSKLPRAFSLSKGETSFEVAQSVFCDLFASRVMIGTPIEDKDILYNEFKKNPFMLSTFKRDMSYFDVLF